MSESTSIVLRLKNLIDSKENYKIELEKCITEANWTPPYSESPITNLEIGRASCRERV